MIIFKLSYIFLLLVIINGVASLAINDVSQDEEVLENRDESVFDQIANHNKAVVGETKTWLFEGDIELVDEPEELKGQTPESMINTEKFKRSLRRNMEYLWIDRVVPYEFTSDVDANKDIIRAAMDDIQKQSCIKFTPRTNEKNWIRFENKGSCFSTVGRCFWRDGYQIVSLTYFCQQSKGTIMHEILHALGFWHEQSRTDRNQFVEIMWENIADGEIHNFEKYSRGESDDLHSVYDYSSIMHYGRKSFSKNGKPTIVAIGDYSRELGQRDKLSPEDITQLNALYRCQDVGKIYTAWSDWSPCDNKCKKTRSRFCSNYDAKKCPEASLWGVHNDEKQCTNAECYKAINGYWGRWSLWSECSNDCGQGKKTRKRECNDPEPKHGGFDCHGDKIQSSDCFVKPCGLGADDCQFEGQGMCFWKDISSNPKQYMWKRIKGNTPTGSTGPDGDHTTSKSTKDGYYLYTEASSPAKTGNKASLLSKAFPKINNRCLTFFYSMHGLGIGTLRIFTVVEGTGYENKIWEKTGPQGKGWQEADVDFSSKYSYRIRFESERGASFQGDIGIDDVYFVDRKCSEKDLGITTKTTTTTTTTTTTATTTTVTANLSLKQYCGVAIEALGCHADISSDPALDKLMVSHRNKIDWNNYDVTLKSLLCDCINLAKDSGYKYIGLQYYGECWGGSKPTYNRHGNSNQCLNQKYNECNDVNNRDICIGKGSTNYIYRIL